MRKINQAMLDAIRTRRSFNRQNRYLIHTEGCTTVVFYYTKVAEVEINSQGQETITFNDHSFWSSPCTRDLLNALITLARGGLRFYQRDFIPMIANRNGLERKLTATDFPLTLPLKVGALDWQS